MPKILDNILKKYVDSVRMLYGEELKKVILYGSYARGDCGKNSERMNSLMIMY